MIPLTSDLAAADREPTPDEQAGMDWWNGLAPLARRVWLADGSTPAEAWRAYSDRQRANQTCPRHEGPRSYCGCGLPLPGEDTRPHSVREADIRREHAAFEKRVLREGHAVTTDDSAEVAELVNAMTLNPYAVAERIIRLERHVAALAQTAFVPALSHQGSI